MKFATINQNVRSIKWAKLLNKTILSKRVLYVIVNIFAFLSRLFADEKWVEVFLFGSGYYHLHMAFPHISALFVPPNEKYQGTFRSRKFPHISHPKTQEAKTRLESSSIYPLFFSKSPKMSDFLLPTWFLNVKIILDFPYVFTIIHLITPFSTFYESLFHNHSVWKSPKMSH